MKNRVAATIEVQGTVVSILSEKQEDYICLTDIARYKDPERTDYLISNWLRNRNTVEFLGIWEQLYNPAFNPIEFDGIKAKQVSTATSPNSTTASTPTQPNPSSSVCVYLSSSAVKESKFNP